jgi:hypothetical protein
VDLKIKYNEVLSKIKIQNRNHLISKLETGDLIKIKSDVYPLVYHYGIIEKTNDEFFIIHNHPDKINSKGGNTVREALDKWIKGKDILSVEKTGLDLANIKDIYENLKPFKYDFFNFNCEHFVNFAKDKSYISPQVIKYTSITIVGLFVYYLIRNKKI